MTDSAGNVGASYTLDPFGTTSSTTGTAPNPWRFAGEYREGASANIDLYKIGARYYDHSNGRWTQRDPLDSPADIKNANRYAYAAGDPVNLTDPSGLKPLRGRHCRRRSSCPKRSFGDFIEFGCFLGAVTLRIGPVGGAACAGFTAIRHIP